jgi:hypothetical protein
MQASGGRSHNTGPRGDAAPLPIVSVVERDSITHERIHIVEDEKIIAMEIAEHLQSHGYQPLGQTQGFVFFLFVIFNLTGQPILHD